MDKEVIAFVLHQMWSGVNSIRDEIDDDKIALSLLKALESELIFLDNYMFEVKGVSDDVIDNTDNN